jgi:hypothetical protein
MSQKPKLSRRGYAFIGMVLVAVLIAILLAFELISVLYVLATLSLVALLLIVAFDDLEGVSRDAVDGFAEPKK